MSRNRRHRQARSDEAQFERAQREFERGLLKECLKSAKVCFRQNPSPERRQLLERAYARRVEELNSMRLPDQARAMLAELLALSPATPEVRDQIPRLRLIVGDPSLDAAAALEARPELVVELADQAVLDFATSVPEFRELHQQVIRTREALLAVERGDDAAAAELVREIPRSSPLSDWRLFLRGLTAFYARQDDAAREAWKRLAAGRPAQRIAQALMAAGGLEPLDAADGMPTSARRLEAFVQRDAVVSLLKQLAEAWRDSNMGVFFPIYRQLRQHYVKSHAAVISQIVDLIWRRAVRQTDEELLSAIERIGPAPALDPHWHRAHALLFEQFDTAPIAIAHQWWTKYAADLEHSPVLRDDERELALALVYRRIALLLRYAHKQPSRRGSWFSNSADEPENLLEDAAAMLRRSIAAAPRFLKAYRELAELLATDLKDPEQAAGVHQQLLEKDPHEYASHVWLAEWCQQNMEPDNAVRHVEAVQQLKPRDDTTRRVVWNQHLVSIRAHVKKRRFDAARREWTAASTFCPPDFDPSWLDVLRAVLERKARNLEAAQRFEEAALSKAGDPALVWLQFRSIMSQYQMTKTHRTMYVQRLDETLRGAPRSRAAGLMARFARHEILRGTRYPGSRILHGRILDYVHRCKKLDWSEFDLAEACLFLYRYERDQRPCRTLCAQGLKKFPQNPCFHYLMGRMEFDGGPAYSNPDKASFHMRHVLESTGSSDSLPMETMQSEARRVLALIEDMYPSRRPADEDDEDDWDGDSDSPDAFEDFSPADMTSADIEAMIADARETMDPEVFASVERVAKQTGMTIGEVLRMLLKPLFQAAQTAGRAKRPTTSRRSR